MVDEEAFSDLNCGGEKESTYTSFDQKTEYFVRTTLCLPVEGGSGRNMSSQEASVAGKH